MLEEIVKTAKLIVGDAGEAEALLETLCAASERQLRARLRAGVNAEDCREAFICAGAWLAVAALCEARVGDGGELSSLRAGEVSVEVNAGSGERAASLRRSAAALMAPYTEGGGFFFCTVKG